MLVGSSRGIVACGRGALDGGMGYGMEPCLAVRRNEIKAELASNKSSCRVVPLNFSQQTAMLVNVVMHMAFDPHRVRHF